MKRDNALLDLTYYTKDFKLNSQITIQGTCHCGNNFSKQFSRCDKHGGMFCKLCVIRNSLEKCKQTNLKNIGVEHPLQSREIKDKIKETNMRIRGVPNPGQCEEVKKKMKETNMRIRGVSNPGKSKEVRDKAKQTNMRIRGVPNPGQCEEVKKKMKETNIRKRGVEYPTQSNEVRDKVIQTNLTRLGVKYVMQNPLVAEKVFKASYQYKKYQMPSGIIHLIQGYENFALDILIKQMSEQDIITSKKDVPEIWYSIDNIKHRHYVDIYIPSIKKCIEVKSIYTYKIDQDKVLTKQKAAKEIGYQYEIWVFNNKAELVNKII